MSNEMLIGEVVSFCDSQFSLELQESYDNSGFQLGERDVKCTGVLVALDLTPQVIKEAVRLGLNLIVTHHPFIFSGLKHITTDDVAGQMVYALISNKIAVYSAHTNLDNMSTGVNYILSQKLGLTDVSVLRPMQGRLDAGSGMIGLLGTGVTMDVFLNLVKNVTGIPFVRTTMFDNKEVRRVAICGGSGAFLIDDAIKMEADLFLTADLKYHDFQKAEGRIVLADIGHFESEQFAKELIYSVISQKFSTFACRISDSANSYVRYI